MIDVSIVWLITGTLIGFLFGFLTCSMVVTGKISDLETEVYSLRAQRKMLKNEVQRLDRKVRHLNKRTYKKGVKTTKQAKRVIRRARKKVK